MLEASGVATEYDTIVERVYVPGLEGSLQVELLAAAREFGRIAYPLPSEPAAVLAEVSAGRPVLVLLNLGLPKRPVWHYAVVVGFDPTANRLLLHSGRRAWTRQRAGAWMRRWDWAGRWAMVLLRPGEWPGSPERERLLGALAAFENSADPGAVATAWQTAAEHWPDEAVVWLGVGNAAYGNENWQAAKQAYERALALDPELLPGRLNLALSYKEMGSSCEAIRRLGTAPTPDHPLAGTFASLETQLRSSCADERRLETPEIEPRE